MIPRNLGRIAGGRIRSACSRGFERRSPLIRPWAESNASLIRPSDQRAGQIARNRVRSTAFALRPNCPPSKNLRSTFVIELSEARKRLEERRGRVPRLVGLLRSAEEWRGLLDRREVANRTELAERAGVSVRRVGQILALLKLHPDVRAAIAALPPGTSAKFVSERKLRELTSLAPAHQLARLQWLTTGRKAG